MDEALRVQALRTRHLLGVAPDLASHIASLIPRSGGGAWGVRVSGSKELPLPLNAVALEDVNGMYAQLVNWSTSISRSMGVRPPVSVLGWMRKDANCDGLPSWAQPDDVALLVGDVSRWLSGRCAQLAHYPLSGVFFEDVREIVGPLLGRYPLAPRPRTRAARDCPVCDERRTVMVQFEEGDVVRVVCTHCGHEIPEAVVGRFLPTLEVA